MPNKPEAERSISIDRVHHWSLCRYEALRSRSNGDLIPAHCRTQRAAGVPIGQGVAYVAPDRKIGAIGIRVSRGGGVLLIERALPWVLNAQPGGYDQ